MKATTTIKQKQEYITVHVKRKLHQELKDYAIQNGLVMQSVAERAIREYLQRNA